MPSCLLAVVAAGRRWSPRAASSTLSFRMDGSRMLSEGSSTPSGDHPHLVRFFFRLHDAAISANSGGPETTRE
eukprot:1424717-Alexandrium_andersonii.AAC.2